MRSLWQDIGAVEDSMPQLQKVGAELAATSGRRGHRIAYALCPLEVSLDRGVVT